MALENMATAKKSDRTLVALLDKKTAASSTQVTTLTANLATAQSENSCLKKFRNCWANAGAQANY